MMKRMAFCLLLVACESGALNFGIDGNDQVEQVPGMDTFSGDASEELFDESSIPDFELGLSSDALWSLERDPYVWVEGSFTYKGQTYSPVGIRLKGENSFLPIDEKPSFKVKFNKYVQGGRFLGLKELTFNNMSGDNSMMHERVAYRMYREFGVAAARSHHAVLSVNGESYGLYANVENVDKTMVDRWYDTTEARLFEVWDVDFYDEYISSFELEYGDDDRSNLQGTADALETPGEAGWEAMSEFMNVEMFQRYWAVGAVVAQFDSYPYSNPGDDCHVFDDPTTGNLHFMPHGLDETFDQPNRNVQGVNGIVAARCLQVSRCKSEWISKVQEVLDLADEIDLAAYADEVAAQIEPYVKADKHKPYGSSSVESNQNRMINLIVDRRKKLEGQLGF